ncbi:MAG: VWA domain-containing protein [Acidobacteriota bacterium]
MKWRTALLAAVALLSIPCGAAPEISQPGHSMQNDTPAQAKTPPQGKKPDFSIEAPLVDINVLVTDEDGRAISGLRKANFRVLDNGLPQTITHFSPTTAPITIAMLLEYSSGSYSYYASKSASWGTRFLDELEPRDWVALVTYDMRPTVRVDFTHNRASIRDALGSLGRPVFSDANLFDALLETLDKLEPVRGRKSILLLSTGANTFSQAIFDEVNKRVKATDVTIFTIGLAEEEYTRSQGSNVGYLQARSWLQSFAEQTGGVAFFPRFPAELPDIFRSVTGFLRNEYTLAFSPPKELRDGKTHRLTVQVIGPDGKPLTVRDDKGRERKLTVFARSGYQAPSTAAPQAPSEKMR